MNQTYKKLIPSLSAEEYEGLEKSILAEGCRDAIVVWGDTIIDGHNRYEICTKHGIEFRTAQKEFADETDAKIWIIQNQFGRRNISTYQRAELALELKPLIAEKAKKNQQAAGGDKKSEAAKSGCQISDKAIEPIDTKKELAKTAGVSHDTIAKVEKIKVCATPEVKAKVETGVMSINEAYKQVKKEELKEEHKNRNESISKNKPEEINKLYDVIVVDPPWPVKKIERDVRPNQSAELDYPTMTVDEISNMTIPASNDCHLFLWTTHKYLPDAINIMSKWGFRYVLCMVWHKNGGFQPIGLPQYNCEFVIYGRKGSPSFTDTKSFNTCFSAPRGAHSEKPELFYETIRRVTEGSRIDMFNRRSIDGFVSWGNQALDGR